MALNFKNRGGTHTEKFSLKEAREVVRQQFGSMGLKPDVRRHFERELDKGGRISGKEFNKIINDAHAKGMITSRKAEKMKDSVNLPDNFNKHLS